MKKPIKFFFQLIAMVAFGILGFLFVKNWRSHKSDYQKKINNAVANIKGRLGDGSVATKKAARSISTVLTSLTPRQQQVYEIISEYGTVEMKDLLMQIKGVTERTLRRDLLKLQLEGLVTKKGTTKAVSYTRIK